MNQLKSVYNSPLKDLHSHSIHTCFPIIASNDNKGYGAIDFCNLCQSLICVVSEST